MRTFSAAVEGDRRQSIPGRGRWILLGLLILWPPLARAQFPAQNVDLLSHLTLADFASGDAAGNDCWGYTAPSGREYALMGLERGVSVVEISDPHNPVIVGRVNHSASPWADIKVFGEFCYVVTDQVGSGIQVISLQDVDNGNVALVRNVTESGLSTAHNIALNTESGFLYTCDSNVHFGLAAYDLSDPANPTFAGAWNGASTHDAAVVSYTTGPLAGREIAYCSDGGSGVDVVDVTDKANMFLMARRTYPGQQFTHQAWPSEDLRYLYVNDELDEVNSTTPTTRTLIFDIDEPNNPVLVGTATTGLPSTDHNLYVRGTTLYEANYTSGLRLFDLADPVNPAEIGFFDTFPSSDVDGFDGAWSVFPFFPSGTVIVSDISGGLFVLDVSGAVAFLSFDFPNGQPEFLSPAGDTIRVVVSGRNSGSPQSGTGMLHYDAGSGLVSVPMQETTPNVYDAVFPALACRTPVTYYVSAQTTTGETATSPGNAPTATFSAVVAEGVNIGFQDEMEAESGWVVDPNGGDDAASGIWTRGDPIGTLAQPEDDHTDDPGTNCWFTGQGSPGGSLGENDVDVGRTTLLSPVLDLTGLNDPQIRYWRWYSNNTGNAPNADVFVIDITSDDGASWVNVETVGPSGDEVGGGWIRHQFVAADFVVPTAQVRLRFVVSDLGSGSIVEAAIDDVRVSELSCGQVVPCPGDLDGDADVDLDDLTLLLQDFGCASGCAGDLDGDGDTDLDDLTLLLQQFGAVCA